MPVIAKMPKTGTNTPISMTPIMGCMCAMKRYTSAGLLPTCHAWHNGSGGADVARSRRYAYQAWCSGSVGVGGWQRTLYKKKSA